MEKKERRFGDRRDGELLRSLDSMIVSSGYNVYPGQLENILDANEKVQMSCVIGIPDPYKMQAVKAFIMLKPGVPSTEETRNEIMDYCRERIAKYAMASAPNEFM